MKIRRMGTLPDCTDVKEVVIANESGMAAHIITYGAVIKNLKVPDENGNMDDLVLGQDTLEEYRRNPSCSAAVIGRVANRIKGGEFHVNGRGYWLECNDRGNCLHSGSAGYASKNFHIAAGGDDWVTLYWKDSAADGFPGSVSLEVTYRVMADDALDIRYRLIPEEDTPVNLTNHVYFNLSGGKDATVFNHEMRIMADFYTPVTSDRIPTGEIRKVAGTNLDFTNRRTLGEVLNETLGLDDNYVLRGWGYRKAAELWHEKSGRWMEVYTDQPGIQIYTGNHFDGRLACKGGVRYEKYAGICFETQGFPNAVNCSHFPDCIVRKNTVFASRTTYRFHIGPQPEGNGK